MLVLLTSYKGGLNPFDFRSHCSNIFFLISSMGTRRSRKNINNFTAKPDFSLLVEIVIT